VPLLAGTALIGIGACGKQAPPSPAAIFGRADAQREQGHLLAAQSQAEAGYRRFLGNDEFWANKFRLLEAEVLVYRGLNQEAIKVLGSAPVSWIAKPDQAAHGYLLEALAFYRLSQDDKSSASLLAAEKVCPSDDLGLLADLETTRGLTEGDWLKSEADFHRALILTEQGHDAFRQAGAFLNLGFAAMNREHYDQSIAWLLQAKEISRQDSYTLIDEKATGNLGWDYSKLGDLDKAASLYEDAAAKALSLSADRDQARWLNNLGLIYYQRDGYTLAEDYYRRSLAIDVRLEDKHQETIALSELAFVSIQENELSEAAQFADRAADPAQNGGDRPLELVAMLARGLIDERSHNDKEAKQLLSQVAQDPGNDRRSVRWEAQAALADLYAGERRNDQAEGEYRAALETVREARCDIGHQELRLPFLNNATRVYDGYIDFLVQQRKAAEALSVADQSRALSLAEGMGVEGQKCLASEAGFDPRSVARRTKATILVYWLGAEHSYLWVIDPDRMKLFPLPPAVEIASAVDAYSRTLVGPRDVLQSGDQHGEYLYRTLIAPAADFFRQDGRVIVVADGALSGLGFDSLIVPQPAPHYWIEDVTVENASSMRLLAKASKRKPASKGELLLMGNPLPVAEFPALPHAAEEVGRVKADFSAANEQVYERSDATNGSYLASHPEQFTYIHFVAHGTASLTDPLDSAVVLSPPPSAASSSDGGYKLYARDIVAHPVKAELVTISACSSAGKRIYKGEGLVGLSWAFLGAGAHNVIGSLWDISDDSSPELMAALYSELGKGRTPDAALRAAKLSLLHSSGVFHKPIYWAAFQLYTGP